MLSQTVTRGDVTSLNNTSSSTERSDSKTGGPPTAVVAPTLMPASCVASTSTRGIELLKQQVLQSLALLETKLTSEEVDLRDCPTPDLGKGFTNLHHYTLGDLHASDLKLLYFLIRHNFVKPPRGYKRFGELTEKDTLDCVLIFADDGIQILIVVSLLKDEETMDTSTPIVSTPLRTFGK